MSVHDDINYIGFVRQLAKPGRDIIDSLSPHRAHCLHMAVGLIGEVVELISAVANKDRENTVEELGDIYFYRTGLVDSLYPGCEPTNNNPVEGSLLFFAGEILDLIKKLSIYNKPMYDLEKKLSAAIVNFDDAFEALMEEVGTSLEEIKTHNINKLSKRYVEGYSDAAAQARADKKEGE